MARSLRAYLMAFFGQITKRKLLNDTLPLRTMKKWCQQKGLVGMFPEGQFSWDGSPSPLQPGLKQLVDYLGVPVVTVRLYNGDHFWPAWAKKPRRTKIKIEIDKPIRISATDDVEAIIKNRIHIDPKKSVPYIANSHKDLALGLSAFVRYCHLCHTDQSLTDLGNFLVCNSCKKTYELSSSNALIPLETGPDSVTSIAEYWSQIKTYVEKKLLLKESLASLNEITLFDATQMDWHPITKGYIQYEDGKITINDWTLSLKEVLAYTLDWGDLILIRTERKRFALKMPGESRAIWSLVLDQSVKKKNDAIQTTTE